MKFLFADSLDFVDPNYDFLADRHGAKRVALHGDQFPHEFLDEVPYDGMLVSRGIVGDGPVAGKYTDAQIMRFRREGARSFLRFEEARFPDTMMMGDCGAFTYRAMAVPPYGGEDTAEFYADGRFTHGCSPDHIIFDFDAPIGARTIEEIPEDVRSRYEVTLQNAAEFKTAAKAIGPGFTPMGVIQGWSAASMADAAADLVKMGYDYLALGGTVPLKIHQLRQALAAIRSSVPSDTRLHVLGFGKIECLADLEHFGVTSFDTTSPLVRAFKDAKKNYWMRDAAGDLSYYTAIRIPQATENNKLKAKALEGSVNQEEIRVLESAALAAVRAMAGRTGGIDEALDAVMEYWAILNWNEEASPSRRAAAAARQRAVYARTLGERPWEDCTCRVCREGGVEALIFRNSNRNKRRGMHNLHVFHRHLQEFRTTEA